MVQRQHFTHSQSTPTGQSQPLGVRGSQHSHERQSDPSAQPDAHALAQQVYRILKQRLMLERERAGAWRSR